MGASAEDIALFAEEPKKKAAASGPATDDDIAMFSEPGPASQEMRPDNAGPEARKARGGAGFREPKSDDELGLDEGPKFSREFPQPLWRGKPILGGISGGIVPRAQDAPGTEKYAAHHAGDEMNDPGAQMLTGAALAAPLAAVAPAAIAPGVAGAEQSAMAGQNPVTGFALGMIPGAARAIPSVARAVPAAVRAADSAIGAKALNVATSPTLAPALTKAGKVVGAVTGTTKGLASGGPLGAYGGYRLGVEGGAKAGAATASTIQKTAAVIARRHLLREAEADLARATELPPSGSPISDRAARSMANTIGADAQRVVPGPRAVPRATGFTANPPPIPERPVAPPPEAAAIPPAATAAKPRARLQITDENGRDLIANPPTPAESLRANVARDAQRFKSQPYDVDETAKPPAPDIGGQLDQSLQVLNLMKQAKDAGTLTPALVRSAVKLGMPAQAVLKIAGPDLFKQAMRPPATATPEDLGL